METGHWILNTGVQLSAQVPVRITVIVCWTPPYVRMTMSRQGQVAGQGPCLHPIPCQPKSRSPVVVVEVISFHGRHQSVVRAGLVGPSWASWAAPRWGRRLPACPPCPGCPGRGRGPFAADLAMRWAGPQNRDAHGPHFQRREDFFSFFLRLLAQLVLCSSNTARHCAASHRTAPYHVLRIVSATGVVGRRRLGKSLPARGNICISLSPSLSSVAGPAVHATHRECRCLCVQPGEGTWLPSCCPPLKCNTGRSVDAAPPHVTSHFPPPTWPWCTAFALFLASTPPASPHKLEPSLSACEVTPFFSLPRARPSLVRLLTI